VTRTLNLTKDGTGTLTLANAENNTYTGSTTIDGGTLVEQPSSSVDGGTWTRTTSGTTIESGGRLILDSTAQSGPGSRQNVGTITINSGGYLELTNTASSVDRSIWSAGSILGSGTLVKSGPGHQDIAWSGSKTSLDSFAGAISIDDGYLIINPNAGVVAGSGNFDVTVDATLDIRTGTFKIDALDGSGTVYESDTGNTSILWLGNNNGDGNFSGSIQNDIRVLKNGSGTQTLSGANTTTGYLTINEGVLALAAGGSLSEETVVRIYSGAQMDLANGIDQTVASLYLDGVLQGKGTFGAIGSGADNESNYFSGSGILRLPPVGSVFKFK
jgi:fibronectin-binding autotransporter adhesin